MKSSLIKLTLSSLPHYAICRLGGKFAEWKAPKPILRTSVKLFEKMYEIDMDEMADDLDSIRSFGEFFTRRLKTESRPVDPNPRSLVFPSDGVIAGFGRIERLRLTQIKGKSYQAAELLSDEEAARKYDEGHFATIYLSPRNYHRVHCPVAGRLLRTDYIPGRLFPVNSLSVNNLDRLYTINERLVFHLETEKGALALVMVGALVVGKISQSVDPLDSPFLHGERRTKSYSEPIPLKKGQELGVFHLGSTVVMLFPKGMIGSIDLTSGRPVKYGERMGLVGNDRR